jgi:hypothetical protein
LCSCEEEVVDECFLVFALVSLRDGGEGEFSSSVKTKALAQNRGQQNFDNQETMTVYSFWIFDRHCEYLEYKIRVMGTI